jgi:hypothetical protein
LADGILEHERGRICPLCGRGLEKHYQAPTAGGSYDVDCSICGHYAISATLEGLLATGETRRGFGAALPFLRAHIRQATDRGEVVMITTENYEAIVRAHEATPVESQVRKTLELICRGARLGEWRELDLELQALRVDAKAPEEALLLLQYLEKRGLVEREQVQNRRRYRATVEGWDWATPLGGAGLTGVAFVAMWFDPSMDGAYEAIKAAVEVDCGLKALRVDRIQHNEQITNRILADIRSAQFTIADVTGQRQGVYFEAGFALGLNRPVIWCCREDQIGEVHFDTRQFSHVVWKDPEALRSGLRDRIRGTILETRMRLG